METDPLEVIEYFIESGSAYVEEVMGEYLAGHALLRFPHLVPEVTSRMRRVAVREGWVPVEIHHRLSLEDYVLMLVEGGRSFHLRILDKVGDGDYVLEPTTRPSGKVKVVLHIDGQPLDGIDEPEHCCVPDP